MRGSKGRKKFTERNVKRLYRRNANCVKEGGENGVMVVRQWWRVPDRGRVRYGGNAMAEFIGRNVKRICDREVLVKSPAKVFDEGIQQWKYSLVGQFIEDVLNFGAMQKIINTIWYKYGEISVHIAGNSLYIFQFSSSEACSWIFKHGPWHIQNKPLILRRWESNLKKLEFSLDYMPVCIHLSGIPLELYTRSGLSYITSAIGNPLYMDRIIVDRTRLSYAKLCIEVSTTVVIPRIVNVELLDGLIVSIVVSVTWLLAHCIDCYSFDYSVKVCPKKASILAKVWNPKQSGFIVVLVSSSPPKKHVQFASSSNRFEILNDDLPELPCDDGGILDFDIGVVGSDVGEVPVVAKVGVSTSSVIV
ncbi:hypothetical protein GOBAR_DD08807 [Gossypium barbadense]|nr:hypothetical protein GOBAR_DD08807 [Gossypium barbadense]